VAEKPKMPEPQPVKLSSKTTALIIVDMQNDFCKKQGKLYVGPMCDKSIPCLQKLLNKARAAKLPIIYTQDWHIPDDPEFKIWPPHTVQDTWGSQIIDELKPTEGDYLIKKQKYDGFFKTELEDLLKKLGVDTVIVTGTVSNICVMHTAGSAALRGYKVVVPIDAISAINDYGQELAIYQMSFLYRAEITTTDKITFQ
jgi:nicotinamidase-related amidase